MSTKPCVRGHLSGRQPSGKCIQCSRERSAAYRAANLERVRAADRARSKEVYKANPEKHKSRNDRWRKANPERWKEICRAKGRNWMRKNKQKAKVWMDKWRAENPHKFLANVNKRRAAIRNAVPSWSEKEKIKEVYRNAKRWGFEVDHVVPLNHPKVCGLHVWANLQLLSKEENLMKKNYHWPDMP